MTCCVQGASRLDTQTRGAPSDQSSLVGQPARQLIVLHDLNSGWARIAGPLRVGVSGRILESERFRRHDDRQT